ncbi:hypothetical protein BCR35DRAFT_265213 [Leucosporidium creatinivorum]|uniref:Nuclear segregation protein Bfr1 n=1 Tax=Leucosporidium creatinivorum TaxID=106004 RepID=A0A1Y2FL80_9BASI|nr:hypothetical protein BCR35DRAFT_265213 [Leucosporidium creatinivorum]
MVVGIAQEPVLSKKQQAAARKQASAPSLPTSRGHDPTVSVVEKKKTDEREGRPDKASYDKEQDALRAQIDALQLKSNDVRNRIAAVSGKGPNHERKVALRAELDSLRGEQARIKGGRGKTLDQVKLMQDNVGRKIKDLQAAKAKAPFKTVADVDNQIKALEKSVDSGRLTIVDEKRALAEMSSLKKTRKTVESFAAQQAAIDAEKAKIDEVRAALDDPEAKSISDKFNAARAELDKINKEHDEASKGRDALFEERNAISKELDAVFSKKKQSVIDFRAANDKFYQKLNDDRAKRIERQRSERQAHEDAKRSEINQRLLEEAQAPAFEREIEDCRTLIDFFEKRIGLAGSGSTSNGGALYERSAVAGVPQLELRKVETEAPKGAVVAKKKGEQEEESWGGFGGKKGKKGGKKAPAPAAAAEEEKEENGAPKNEALNLPLGTLTALLSLGITSPLTTADVPKAIESLQVKKKYFVDNQARVTKDNVAAAEKKIAQAEAKSKASSTNGTSTPAAEETAAPAVEATADAEVEKTEEAPVDA